MWTILDEISKNKRKYLVVQCSCGYIGERRKDWVLSERSSKCKSCSAKDTAKKSFETNSFFNKSHLGLGLLSRTKFGTYKFGAKRRNIPFEITIQDAWNVWTGKCALSGIALEFNEASLDRIDSSVGYIVGNIQWVHIDINYMKQSLPEHVFIKWCSLVHANQQPSSENNIKVSEKVQRLEGEEFTNNPSTSAQHLNGDDIV